MKFRMVKTTGVSSHGDINVAFSVEYKKHFFSKWKEYCNFGYVDSTAQYKVVPQYEKCLALLKALRERGTTNIRTVLGE
jgi:hypothetical protein